jgi:hypothetical protein
VTPGLPDPAASAAVLIGTSTYQDPALSPLPGVANNLADLAALLADDALWGLPAQRRSVLLDRADTADTMGSLAGLADQALDTFIVYYSGHGVLARDGELLLSTPATNSSRPKYTALPFGWVRDVIGYCRAARRIVILDCCFSGRALHAMSDPATAVIGQVGVDGVYVMTSAPATSPSIAPPGDRYTAFTGGLLRILREGVRGASEVLTLDDVYDQILVAMARRGWPRPQRLGTNTVGRLAILRNTAWRSRPKPPPSATPAQPTEPAEPEPPAEPAASAQPEMTQLGRYRQLAEGVREAVAVVAASLGSTGQDGLIALDRAFPPAADSGQACGVEPGVALVRDTMLAMREQYGDGAATAAVILGTLVDGLYASLESGAEPDQLDAALRAHSAELAAQLAAAAGSATAAADTPSADQMSAAVWTALGRGEITDAVVAAARSVGAGNVEVVPGGTGAAESLASMSTFTLASRVLAPNVTSGPITLADPLVVVAPDGTVDAAALRAAAGTSLPAILIVAPRVSIHTVRSLLHVSSQVVVIRPTDAALDLVELRARLHRGGTGPAWGRARRALVMATATTIDRPAADLKLSRNRITLTIAHPAREGRLALAARALAVARSAADGGVAPGAGAALRAAAHTSQPAAQTSQPPAAQSAGPAGPDPVVAALIHAAACEPSRLLLLARGPQDRPRDRGLPGSSGQEAAPTDCLATARGALTHAVATASRYLSGA